MVVQTNRKSATVIKMIILRAVVRKSGDIQNVRKIVKDPMSCNSRQGHRKSSIREICVIGKRSC